MSCDTSVTISSSVIRVTVDGGSPIVVETGSSAIVVDVKATDLVCEIVQAPAILVEVGTPGPVGPPGPTGPSGAPGVGLPVTDLRIDVELDGVINGINKVFTLPNGETAVDLSASGSATINAIYNGKVLHLGDGTHDFTISESGGVGTGYDTVTFTVARPAPKPGDRVTANWIKAP